MVARYWNENHKKIELRVNARRSQLATHGREEFGIGSWVWVLRPKAIVGPKLDTWWRGPFKITHRTGEDSFRVENMTREAFDVHRSQLKKYERSEEMASIYPMCFRLHGGQNWLDTRKEVQAILGHRQTTSGELEFLTHWVGEGASEATWEPMSAFISLNCQPWNTYTEGFGVELRQKSGVQSDV